MGVCIFVARGMNFDVDDYLRESPFEAVSVFRKGQVPSKNNPHDQYRPDSGFMVAFGDDQEPGLSDQVEEALTFLAEHESELERLKEVGVDRMLLHFGVELRDELRRSEYLPPELIMALGRFGMGLRFSTVHLPRG